jgi:hypothetical protein
MNQGDNRLDSYKFTNWGDATFNKGSFKLHPEAALSEGLRAHDGQSSRNRAHGHALGAAHTQLGVSGRFGDVK